MSFFRGVLRFFTTPDLLHIFTFFAPIPGTGPRCFRRLARCRFPALALFSPALPLFSPATTQQSSVDGKRLAGIKESFRVFA